MKKLTKNQRQQRRRMEIIRSLLQNELDLEKWHAIQLEEILKKNLPRS